MKKGILFAICICIFLLSACKQEQAPTPAPVSAVQENVEEENIGNVFAHTPAGDLYFRMTEENTIVTMKSEKEKAELATLEGAWRFSFLEDTRAQAYMLFDGYKETENGYDGCVYTYATQTGKFVSIFEEETSNAVILPTPDENYADLAWMLVQHEDGVMLCPFNLRDGSIEMGQIVSLAETDYAIEGEHVLVSLKTDAQYPLQIQIENKAYAGTSVLSTTTYIYDFETQTLITEGEEQENADQQNN